MWHGTASQHDDVITFHGSCVLRCNEKKKKEFPRASSRHFPVSPHSPGATGDAGHETPQKLFCGVVVVEVAVLSSHALDI